MEDDLLRSHGQACRLVARERDRLVHGVGVERLRAAHDGGQRLDGDPDQVHLRLRLGEGDARRLGVKAHEPRALALRPELLAHEPRPDAAGRAELGHFFEEVVMAVEKEADAGREGVNVQPSCERPLHVLDAVGEGEGQFLGGGRPGLADVIAAHAHRVPERHFVRRKLNCVGDQTHRLGGRVDKLVLSDVLLQNVVLERPGQLRPGDAPAFGCGDEERPDDRGRAVDGHRCRDAVERQSVEQELHVGDGVDRHAAGAEFPHRPRLVVVVPHQSGHVEGDGEAVVPGGKQVLVPLVRLLHRPEAAEHADGPRLPTVARAMNAAGERVCPGKVDVPLVVEAGDVGWVVEALDGPPGYRHEWASKLRALPDNGLVVLLAQFARPVHAISHARAPSNGVHTSLAAGDGARARANFSPCAANTTGAVAPVWQDVTYHRA